MSVRIQVTFDAADPERLAAFWAEVVHYKEQDPPEGFGSWDEWLDANGLQDMKGDASAIVDPQGTGPRFYFQKVPEGKTAKNRLHLDINVTDRSQSEEERTARLESEAQRLVKLGAVRIEHIQMRGESWMVMNDPEGNEFCLQ
jgi:Glyoxalase-like domain